MLLVTGPFKINGVPLRRVNSRYVIATSTKVDIAGIDTKSVDKAAGDDYFAREKSKGGKGEKDFFKQGEKPEVCQNDLQIQIGRLTTRQKKKPDASRTEDQKSIDKSLVAAIKKTPVLASYLASSFSLRKGDKPHEMVW